MACKAAWHKRLKRRFVLRKKKRLLRIRRRTHDPVSEESTWEPPSPDCWEKSWKTPWKDPKGQTWELLSLQQDFFNRVHKVWVKLPPEWPEDAS